mmetsp:Transcript_24909/g.69448  ORF Transcript_24909/g.69448 Transcript_24909/m.69448 type:complete len:272 (+) Transcript_24909:589-1404(+)
MTVPCQGFHSCSGCTHCCWTGLLERDVPAPAAGLIKIPPWDATGAAIDTGMFPGRMGKNDCTARAAAPAGFRLLEESLERPRRLWRYFWRWLAMFCLVNAGLAVPIYSRIRDGTALSGPRVSTASKNLTCSSCVHSTLTFFEFFIFSSLLSSSNPQSSDDTSSLIAEPVSSLTVLSSEEGSSLQISLYGRLRSLPSCASEYEADVGITALTASSVWKASAIVRLSSIEEPDVAACSRNVPAMVSKGSISPSASGSQSKGSNSKSSREKMKS